MKYDIIVAGGGVGGVAAALGAVRSGKTVLLIEETDWLGGQFTSQAVPPDEQPLIEDIGSTNLYRQFREGIRSYYKRHFPLLAKWRKEPNLNPGNGTVSGLCFLPRVGVSVLTELLAVYIADRLLTVLFYHKPVAVNLNGDHLKSVTFENIINGHQLTALAEYFIDATELGELLPLSKAEYVTGSESSKDTGEPHALESPDPFNIEAITWCFAIDYLPQEDHTIERPEQYDYWKSYQPPNWPGPKLSWLVPGQSKEAGPEHEPMFSKTQDGKLSGNWFWRRILDASYYEPGYFKSDISLVNWIQLDYTGGSIYDIDQSEIERNKHAAMQLSLSFLYWMQTEAPRHDGGKGYKGLRLRNDVTDTLHGLAKYPYIRESRRIRAEFTILEQMISRSVRKKENQAQTFSDTVGVGFYNFDSHPTIHNAPIINVETYPFQIPLGALIPVRLDNLIAAAKNIGTTHITNGAYRLHPIEWNIGESAGYLAAFCINHNTTPKQVRKNQSLLSDLQSFLVNQGVTLNWPEEYIDFEYT